MNAPETGGLEPHDVAKAEIEAWRGGCLNLFARGEKAVTDTIIAFQEKSSSVRLEPLAGQRLNSLEKLVREQTATKAQTEAITDAIAGWRLFDERRPLFSHGVATELLDRQGVWHAQLEFLAIQKGKGVRVRETFVKDEAMQFHKDLHRSFEKLAGQLGQVRKRLKH